MAGAPLFSTVSAVTELFVTAAVYFFIHQAYYRDRFHTGIIAFALSYEVLVNIAYMTLRLVAPSPDVEYSEGMRSFLAFHGILSLIMFLGLVGLTVAAIRGHRRGHNLFRDSPGLTLTFVILWAVSIISGEAIYVMSYLV